jgi:arylsulfatase/uncharacterized sulfatase
VGRLVANLNATGRYDTTVFVFLSDNGPEATDPMASALARTNALALYEMRTEQQGRPGSLTAIGAGWASAAASPLRGYKFTASEGGLRVPLVISYPGNSAVAKGRVAHGFAHVVDIAPTLLALAGAPAATHEGKEPMTGHSLMPMLTGAATAVRAPDEATGYELSGNAVLWKGDLKLVKNLPPYGTGRWQLFDIVRDPGETRDLVHARPAAVKAMQADYAAFAKGDGVLAMPAGYTAPDQIIANALDTLLWPRLRQLLPWLAPGLALWLGFSVWVARRRPRMTS